MSPRDGLVFSLIGIIACGCTEGTAIRSLPPGSTVFVNDQRIGLTPVRYAVPVEEMDKEYRVRVERHGYHPAEGILDKDFCGGRIAAGIFTLGIFFLFKDTDCFKGAQDFVLKPLESEGGVGTSLNIDKRLERIERLRRQGTITEEEFGRYRKQILDDL